MMARSRWSRPMSGFLALSPARLGVWEGDFGHLPLVDVLKRRDRGEAPQGALRNARANYRISGARLWANQMIPGGNMASVSRLCDARCATAFASFGAAIFCI